MKCPICGNEKAGKRFVAGITELDSKVVGCDKCVGKKRVAKIAIKRKTKKRTKKK